MLGSFAHHLSLALLTNIDILLLVTPPMHSTSSNSPVPCPLDLCCNGCVPVHLPPLHFYIILVALVMLVIFVLFDLCRGGGALAHPPLDFTFFLVIGFVVVLLAIRVCGVPNLHRGDCAHVCLFHSHLPLCSSCS